MRFRFPARWQEGDHRPNPLTEAVTSRKAAGRRLLDLTVSNPTSVGFPFPDDWPRLLSGTDHMGGEGSGRGRSALHDYVPDPKGLLSARRAIADYLRGNGAARTTPDDIFLTAGTSEGYSHLFRLLCEPGDTVLVPRPSYPLLDTLAGLSGITVASYPLRLARPFEDTPHRHDVGFAWRIDRAALAEARTDRTKAIVVVSPNNPTGNLLLDDDARWMAEFAAAHGLALIVDTVFADYTFGEPKIAEDTLETAALSHVEGLDAPLVFTLNGLSKLVGLPQLKLAWIHVAGNAADVAVAKDALEWMCDAALSVGTASQLACAELLRRRAEFQEPIRARLAENLDILRKIASATPSLQPLWPQGGWCIPIRCREIDDDEVFAIRLVEETGVLVQPGYFFDFEDDETIVVSLLTPPETFREGVRRIASKVI